MVKGDILLNNQGYYLRRHKDGSPYMEQYLVDPFGTPFHATGLQSPQEMTMRETILFPNFSLGFGRNRTASDSAGKVNEYRRFWDSTLDTREIDTYLPILEEDSGLETVNDQILRASVQFRGNLIGLWEFFDSTNYRIYARRYDGANTDWQVIGSDGLLRTTFAPKIGRDIIETKNGLAALIALERDHLVYISGNQGETWTVATTQITGSLISSTVTANQDLDIGLFANIGGILMLAIYHESNATVTFFSSTDGGDNWTDRSADIITSNGPQGIAVMAGIDNEDKIYLCLTEGLYEVDTAVIGTITSRLIFPMVPHAHNGRGMKIGDDGALWFAQGVDNDTPPIVYRMVISNGERRIEAVPNDFSDGDGLPSDMLGTIRTMLPVRGYMYASMGGGIAGRKARIVCHNGSGWHSIRKHGTENQQILWMAASPHDDDKERLHYTVLTSPTAAAPHFLGQAFANPASGVTIKREASGYIDLPYIDFGFPLDTKTIGRVGINAEDLSVDNTGEYINVDYGSVSDLGALQSRNANDLGDYLKAIRTISFASGVGLEALTLGVRVNLLRAATNTKSPKLKDVQIDAVVNIPSLEGHRFQIDIVKTARAHSVTNQAIMTRLKVARDLGTYPTFRWGPDGVQYVKVKPPLRWNIGGGNEAGNAAGTRSAPDLLTQPGGFIEVVVEEPI